ncbi:uncharacterized protein [Amphiura filiformis]|uniref:uncharacterized protein n=1 Tax=Amphiura filiformis TaxID=82378 RepID=UPI003B214638
MTDTMETLNGGDNSGNEIHGKKRRNEAEWTQNKRKGLKATGKEYTTARGKKVAARKTGDKCKCSRQCLQYFSDETKKLLIDKVNSLGDQKAQDSFLSGGISARSVARRRPRQGGAQPDQRRDQRTCSIHYKIKHGEEEKVVCRAGYASLYGVGEWRIRRIANDVFTGDISIDQRGKHDNRPRAVPEDYLRLVDEHIRSFPYQVSHYGRERTKRRYLSSELSVRRMYVLFLQRHFPEAYLKVKDNTDPEKVECAVRHRTYFNYFKDNFNYGFGRPRTDVCGTCAELKLKIGTEKNAATRRKLQTELQLHKRKAKAFYDQLQVESAVAKDDEEADVLAIDFQQNIPYPHLPVGDIFYMRQLWLYNFCIYSAKTQKSTMYMWPETVAKRGSNEVVSCLKHYIDNKLSVGVKKVKVFSDGCRGQNHNHTVVQVFFTLVKTGQLDAIEHRFPIRGHSFLPCDRHFATIEKKKRKVESVDWFPQWIDMVEESFEVVRVQQDLISDYRGHLQQFLRGQ